MPTLRLMQTEEKRTGEPGGTWGELVAWFSEMVICLDKGDLPGAVEAQAQIERHGFKVTYRRRARPATAK